MKVCNTKAGPIPKLGLGTWRLAGEECTSVVDTALKLGYRHLDTAAMYQNEAEVGEGLRASGIARSEVFVTTKVWYDRIGDGDLQASAEESLQRLGLDHVDLLLIHWPNPAIPLEDSIGALCDTVRRGYTRAIGVSNFSSAMIETSAALSSEPLMCNQVEYHPYLTQKKVLAACRNHGMAVTAYAPIARGKVLDDPVISGIAERLGVSATQVTLAWLMGQDDVIAVPKSGNAERLADNLAAVDLELDADDRAAIDALGSPQGRMVDLGTVSDWDTE